MQTARLLLPLKKRLNVIETQDLSIFEEHYFDYKDLMDLISTRFWNVDDFQELYSELTLCLKTINQIQNLFVKKMEAYAAPKNYTIKHGRLRGYPVDNIATLVEDNFMKELTHYTQTLDEIVLLIQPKINPELKIKEKQLMKLPCSVLDVRQAALLLTYMKKQKIFRDYSASNLGILGEYLTGHDRETLRKLIGNSERILADEEVNSVEKSKSGNDDFYNLEVLVTQLTQVIEALKADAKGLPPRTAKNKKVKDIK